MKLAKVIKSPNEKKKWRAVFKKDDGTELKRDFGDSSAEDFTQHGDEERRERYLKRHEKDLKGDPTKAGYLSYYITWGKSKSIKKNIQDYKQKFGF